MLPIWLLLSKNNTILVQDNRTEQFSFHSKKLESGESDFFSENVLNNIFPMFNPHLTLLKMSENILSMSTDPLP
jgi:hypothetical protein